MKRAQLPTGIAIILAVVVSLMVSTVSGASAAGNCSLTDASSARARSSPDGRS